MSRGPTIDLEIVTPDGLLLEEHVEALTAPSVSGDFGVLPGHRPLLAALRTGIVTYVKDGAEIRVAVGPGFAEIFSDRAVLLTDGLVKKDDIDPVQTRLDLKDADEALDRFAGEPGSSEYLELMRKERWAATKLTLYGDPPPPTVHTFHEILHGAHETFEETQSLEIE